MSRSQPLLRIFSPSLSSSFPLFVPSSATPRQPESILPNSKFDENSLVTGGYPRVARRLSPLRETPQMRSQDFRCTRRCPRKRRHPVYVLHPGRVVPPFTSRPTKRPAAAINPAVSRLIPPSILRHSQRVNIDLRVSANQRRAAKRQIKAGGRAHRVRRTVPAARRYLIGRPCQARSSIIALGEN